MTSSTEALRIWYLVPFFLLPPWRINCHDKHLEVSLKAWVTTGWVRPMYAQVLQHSANTAPTDLVKHISKSHSRWFTGWLTYTPSSGHFLFWVGGPLARRPPPPAHTPSPTDGYNQPVVHLLSMKRHGSSIEHMNHLLPVVVQNSILYMLVQLNQSSLEGKQNVQWNLQ